MAERPTTPIFSIRQRLEKYSFECIPGCTDCCGPVPVTPAEAERIASRYPVVAQPQDGIAPFGDDLKCGYAHGRCVIHAERPVICRLFGAVDHPRMRCPHGRGPNRLMSDKQSRRLLRQAGFDVDENTVYV